MAVCEIEIKSLLGSTQRAQEVKDKLCKLNPETRLFSQHKQLNHYFINGDVSKFDDTLVPLFSGEKQKEFKEIIEKGSDFSIRTRLIDEGELIFVIKASLDEGSSHNTISRMEFESSMADMSLDELDRLILDAGFEYQAKWSREREEYKSGNIIVCFDKNAGYGYLAEFEKVIDDESLIESTREELHNFMYELGVEELSQERLERMFTYYNKNWLDYYGTDKIFNIE
jgi:predicted adenylyl cyclase CyaB